MTVYLIRRLLVLVPTLLLITVVVFMAMKLAPGNPFSFAQSSAEGAVKAMDPADYQALLARYGLDRPWYYQYLMWLKNLLTGSLGESFVERRPVSEVLFGGGLSGRLAATLILNLLSVLLMLAVALPAGIYAAARRGGWFDKISGFALYMLYSLPNFWIAILLVILVGVRWKLLPFMGMHSDGWESMSAGAQFADLLKHAILPCVCLTYGNLAFIARFTRGTLLDVVKQDFIRTARAKGLSESSVILKHALRNAMIPLLTLAGMLLASMISGSVIIESVFSWPGLGRLYVDSIYSRDYPVIMAISLMGALAVLISNLLTDISYSFADPKVRLS